MSEPTDVYLLTFGEYDDAEVVGVFATHEEAMVAAGGPDGFEARTPDVWTRAVRFDDDGDYDGLTGIDAVIARYVIGEMDDLSRWLSPGPIKRERLDPQPKEYPNLERFRGRHDDA